MRLCSGVQMKILINILILVVLVSCNNSDQKKIQENVESIVEDIKDPDGTKRKYDADLKEARELFKEAFNYQERKLTNRAIEYYEKAIKISPIKYYAAYGNLAYIYAEVENHIDYNKSISLTNKVILDKNSPKIIKSRSLFLRANCKLNLGDEDGALNDYTECIDLAEKLESEAKIKILKIAYMRRGDLNYNLGNEYIACRDWSEAGSYGSKDAYNKINKYCN